MACLTRDQILLIETLKTEPLEIPEWNGSIVVREATAIERDEYEESLVRPHLVGKKTELKTDFRNSKARLVVKCVIDDKGDRVFGDKDAEALGGKSAAVIDRIFQVVRRLSGMALKSEEELEKNFEGGPSESLPSNSPAT